MARATTSTSASAATARRRWPAALLVALLVTLAPGTGAGARAAAPAAESVAQGLPSAAELEAVIETLEDEAARARLVAQLRALIAAQRQADAEEPAAAGNVVLRVLSERIDALGRTISDLAIESGDPRRLAGWLARQVDEPERRRLWLAILVQAAVAFALGLVAGKAAGLALRRPRLGLERREAPGLWLRLPLAAARAALDILPIAAFAATAYAALALLQPGDQARLVMLAAINAVLIARAGVAVARLTFTPLAPSLRLVALEDATAAYTYIWARRLINIPVYGYYIGQAALALGLPAGGYAVYVKLLGLLVTGMLLALVLQNRDAVAAAIRGDDKGAGRAGRGLRTVRGPLADVWHVLAGLYLLLIYGVWALEIEGGFAFIVRGTIVTAVVLVLARLLVNLMRRGLERAFRVSAEIRARYPLIEQRANLYLAIARRAVEWAIWIAAILILLQAWRIDALGWLGSSAGRAVLASLVEILVVLVIAVIVWESANAAVARFLESRDAEGKVVERSARVRTLLPLARNALLAGIVVISALTILSSLGVEIGPLLAGAGVVGLAIGFGAQTLVKDVITGAFILFEDSIAVGDYIEVGGHSGTVEALTVRTIRLRDPRGTVHTVPFSSIEAITNMTKDFAYHIAEIGVAYREDTDEVVAVLSEVGEDLRQDPEFGQHILAPLHIDGVDSFGDSAVVVRVKLKTAPGMQWRIKREFNRRVKHAFDARGIEIPFPHQTIYFGVDKEGRAPPARVELGGGEQAAEDEERPASAPVARERARPPAAGSEDASDDGADP